MSLTFDNLPRERYHTLKSAVAEYNLPQWYILTAAFDALAYLKLYHPDALTHIITSLKQEFPVRQAPPYGGDGSGLDRVESS